VKLYIAIKCHRKFLLKSGHYCVEMLDISGHERLEKLHLLYSFSSPKCIEIRPYSVIPISILHLRAQFRDDRVVISRDTGGESRGSEGSSDSLIAIQVV
jgi:hypothetical protein